MNHPQNAPTHAVSKRLGRTSLTVIGLALGFATLVGGCVSPAPQPGSMRDPNADFNSYQTFGWDTATSADASGQSQPLSIIDSNIQAAITTELKGKGYEQAAAGTTPDLIVSYEKARADKIKSNPFRIGIGVGGVGSHGGAAVGGSTASAKNVNEGTLVAHVIDRARNAEVWTGHVSRELSKGGNPEPELIQNAIAELFREFPARGAQP
jgi:Domain of unknown function (DUF4136)